MPNLTPIPTGTSSSQATAMMNRNFQQLNNEQVTKLYNDENGTPSILIGLDSTGKSVIKVSKTGVDVTTATNAQLAFNSAQNMFKIAQRTRVLSSTYVPSIVCPGNEYKVYTLVDSYTHGLGYVPQVMGTVFESGSYSPLPFTRATDVGVDGSLLITYSMFTDATYLSTMIEVSFDCIADAGGVNLELPSYDFQFYLLQETAN